MVSEFLDSVSNRTAVLSVMLTSIRHTENRDAEKQLMSRSTLNCAIFETETEFVGSFS